MDVEILEMDPNSVENETTDEILNWDDTCRVCANGADHMIPIYEKEGAEHKLSDKIDRYLPIEISKTDNLPLKLCFHCASTILAWHELITGCLEAEEKLLITLRDNHPKKYLQLQSKLMSSYDAIMDGIMMEDGTIKIHQPITMNEPENSSSKIINRKCSEFSEANKLEDEIVVVNESINDSESTQAGENICESHQETEKILISEQEDSFTIEQLEETSDNEEQNSRIRESIESCNGRDQKKFETSSQAEITDAENSESSEKNIKTKISEETLISPEKKSELSCDKCCRRFLKESNLLRHLDYCKSQGKLEKSKIFSELNRENEAKKVKNEENSEILLNQHESEHSSDVSERKEKNSRIINRTLARRARMVANGRVYYHCDDCGKNLFSTCTFIRHLRIHSGERPYICDLCGKRFRVTQGLINHLRDHHEGIRKFSCDLCGRMFATKQYVDQHRRIHTGERPYVCDICGKSFKQKASLSLHNRTHSDVFPFSCIYCGRKFRTKPPLKIHLMNHTGEKPYTCDICDRPFRSQSDMKSHRLIHFDDKPWQCSDCGASYRQKRYLIKHQKLNPHCGSSNEQSENSEKEENEIIDEDRRTFIEY